MAEQRKVLEVSEPGAKVQGPKVKEQTFRLLEDEEARVDKLIEMCFLLGLIKKQTKQEFYVFSLNCASTFAEETYKQMNARRPPA